jgi:hypothetical protein
MKKLLLIIGCVILTNVPATAQADAFALGVRGGTLGVGLEGIFGINPYFNARVGYNSYNYDTNKTLDDISYDMNLKLRNLGLLIDWHPFRGVFRLTGGVLNNRNSFVFTRGLTLGQVIDNPPLPELPPLPVPIPIPLPPVSQLLPIGDLLFDAVDVGTLSGRVSTKKNAPFLGFGWGNAMSGDSRFGISFDIGVVFQGSPEVDLSATGVLAGNPIFENELAKEEQYIRDDLKEYKYYPAISIGLSYRF